MPLTACMLVVDNSESSRNGDFQPSRFEAQVDSINIIADHVLNDNPESSVGLMSMGGKGPEVLTTLATERGKIHEGLYRTKKKIAGSCHLATAIQIASVCSLSASVLAPAFHPRPPLRLLFLSLHIVCVCGR